MLGMVKGGRGVDWMGDEFILTYEFRYPALSSPCGPARVVTVVADPHRNRDCDQLARSVR